MTTADATLDRIFVLTEDFLTVVEGEGWFETEEAARARAAEIDDVVGRYEREGAGDPALDAKPGYWSCTLEEYREIFGGEQGYKVLELLHRDNDYGALQKGRPAYILIDADGQCEDFRGVYATREGAVEGAYNCNVARFENYLTAGRPTGQSFAEWAPDNIGPRYRAVALAPND